MSPRPKKRLPLHFKNSKSPLDFIPKAYIPIANHPARGAFCRTLRNVGWRRRPLLRLVTAGPGGPGQPSAGMTTGCPKGLDAAGTKAGGSPPDKGSPKGAPCIPPGSTAPGTKKPHGGAPEGDAPLSKRRGSPSRRVAGGCAFRCSTPSLPRRSPKGVGGAKKGAAKSGALGARGNDHARLCGGGLWASDEGAKKSPGCTRQSASVASFSIGVRERRLVANRVSPQEAECQTRDLIGRIVVRARRLNQKGQRQKERTNSRMPSGFIDGQLSRVVPVIGLDNRADDQRSRRSDATSNNP